MYYEVETTQTSEWLFGEILNVVLTVYNSGVGIELNKDLTFKEYSDIHTNLIPAKIALINMLPDYAKVTKFDLIKNNDQDSDIAGTFVMEVIL